MKNPGLELLGWDRDWDLMDWSGLGGLGVILEEEEEEIGLESGVLEGTFLSNESKQRDGK